MRGEERTALLYTNTICCHRVSIRAHVFRARVVTQKMLIFYASKTPSKRIGLAKYIRDGQWLENDEEVDKMHGVYAATAYNLICTSNSFKFNDLF